MPRYRPIARDTAGAFQHMYSYTATATGTLRRLLGIRDEPAICLTRQGGWEWCWKPETTVRQGKAALERLADKRFAEHVSRAGRRSIDELLRYMRWLKRQPLQRLSAARVMSVWRSVWKRWNEANYWGQVPNLADFEHFLMSQKIMAFLEQRLRQTVGLPDAPQVFATLTTPNERTPVQQEEEDFLKLLGYVQANAKLSRLFGQQPLSVDQVRQRATGLWQQLRRHTARYDWLQFHYEGPTILDERYFLETLASAQRQEILAADELAKLKQKHLEVKRGQARLWKAIPFTLGERHWLLLAQEFVYLKGLRKEAVFEASRCLDPFFREVARRLQISPTQARKITIPEMPAALRQGKVDVDLLNERQRSCTIYFLGERSKVYVGKAAERLAAQVERPEAVELDELHGMTAYPGQASGTVKLVIQPEDMAKFQKGDVLVSPATNPNLMAAIRQAAAIVTDEGGITCHAAIVSRELKIPCVIGTKVATRALKDGDVVEVDATKGVVKKVKK